MKEYFDYRVLGYCEYGVPSSSVASGVEDCRENAMYHIWWGDEEDGMFICPEHFEIIKNAEIEERQLDAQGEE